MCFRWQNSCTRGVKSLSTAVRKGIVVSCCPRAPWVQTALATCTVVCSLRGLSCVFWQLLCHMESPASFPPRSWDHRRWGAHLCRLRNTLAVTRRWFTDFCGGRSWISRSPKLEGMLNVLGHLGRKVVTEIQTFGISLGRRVLFRQSRGRDG